LLAIVASAKANGLDSERALRSALRELQSEIRDHEVELASDAGVIGTAE
jgi:XTP/dITP diphosphohydrolase